MQKTRGSGVLEVLGDKRLLKPEQYAELTEQLYPLCPDWQILGAELVYRGWLTAYQMQQVLEGTGRTLFLGSYVLLEPLGEGGMGKVFRARNWKLGKIVAVKVIRHDQTANESTVRRFRREILALSRFDHPNVVHAFDAGVCGTMRFYAMDYIPGIDLGRLVQRNGPLPVPDACNYVAQTAQALQHAHLLGLIHRDIKPSNLLLCTESRSIKVLDLGLARFRADDPEFSQVTRVGALVGTPDYISPEQVQDSHGADIRSDLYSLGCTFYYLLTGQGPFEHEAPIDKLFCHVREEPTPVEALRPDVPPELAAIIGRLMAKNPADRFQEPAELMSALAPLLQSGSDIHPGALLRLGSDPDHTPFPPGIGEKDLAPTQVVSAEDLQILRSLPEEAPAAPAPAGPRRWIEPVRFGVAVLIALGALLYLGLSGHGPGAWNHRGAKAAPAPIVCPTDEGPAPTPAQDAPKSGSEPHG
jgi:eukaryotic-like serine/threonine-protein kinase